MPAASLDIANSKRYVRQQLPFFSLALLLLIAFALRSSYLTNGLGGDEGFTCSMLMQDFSGIVRQTLAQSEPHPLGYYFLEKTWITLTSDTEFAQRFLSVWFGVLAVALTARLSRQLVRGRYGARVAVVAAIFATVNMLALWLSREARMYSMFLALALASVSLMVAMLSDPHHRNWLAYVGVTALVLQVHYYALFIVLAQNIYIGSLLLLDHGRNGRGVLARWITSQLALAALSLPWLYLARGILLDYHGFGSMPTTTQALIQVFSWFSIGSKNSEPSVFFAVISGMLLIIGVIKLARSVRSERRSALLLFLYFAVPVLGIWWLSQSRPVFKDRYLVASLAPFQILLASALVPVKIDQHIFPQRALLFASTGLGVTLAIVVGMGMAINTSRYLIYDVVSGRNQYIGMRQAFEKYSGDFSANQVRWAVTYPDYAFTCYLETPDYLVIPYQPGNQVSADTAVTNLADQGVRRVLLMVVNDTYWQGQTIAPAALNTKYTLVDQASTGTWPLQVYSRPDAGKLHPIDVEFINGINLDSADIYHDRSGNLLEVYLQWRSSSVATSGNDKLFIHVYNDKTPGQLVAQLDTLLDSAIAAEGVSVYGLPLPVALQPGTYDVSVGLYNPDKPGMPRIVTTTGADKLILSHFTVN